MNLCWLTGHNFVPDLSEVTAHSETCPATCSKCGKLEYWTFYQYCIATGIVWLNVDTGTIHREMIETFTDPWGKLKTQETLAAMERWAENGYPGGFE